MRSLLTGSPIGEWHLVLGNPMNPIAMIGNLVVSDAELEFGDVLGADDFPTELKLNVKLRHGKPRDKGDIESMFNLGNGRLYYGISGDVQSSSMYNSLVDTSGTKGNTSAGYITPSANQAAQKGYGPTDTRNSQTQTSETVPTKNGTKYSNYNWTKTARWADPGGNAANKIGNQ